MHSDPDAEGDLYSDVQYSRVQAAQNAQPPKPVPKLDAARIAGQNLVCSGTRRARAAPGV
jgi:hypothetical protein